MNTVSLFHYLLTLIMNVFLSLFWIYYLIHYIFFPLI